MPKECKLKNCKKYVKNIILFYNLNYNTEPLIRNQITGKLITRKIKILFDQSFSQLLKNYFFKFKKKKEKFLTCKHKDKLNINLNVWKTGYKLYLKINACVILVYECLLWYLHTYFKLVNCFCRCLVFIYFLSNYLQFVDGELS